MRPLYKSAILLINVLSLLTETCLANLNIDLESEPEANLFLEDRENAPDLESGSQTDIRYFALVHPSSSISVRANYGPLTVKQTIYPSFWTDINSKRNDSYNVAVNTNSQFKVSALNGELSAHLVTREVRRSNPVLRVLFYAGHTSDYSQRARIDFIDKTLCAAIIVEYHGEKLFGTCSPSKAREGACLAEVTIPSSYWPPLDTNGLSQKQQKATNAKVYYAITHSEHCTDSTFPTTSDQNSLSLNYLSDVSLIPFRGSYEEVTNDNVVTILIPQEPVYPNSKIYIPVKFTYNPEYPIAAFSLRIRVKNGIRILGAQLSHPNKLWQLSVELSPKQTIATVTAFLRDFDLQQDSQSVPDELLENMSQEVYSWLIEVDEEVDISESGRISWQLLYITDSSSSVKQDFEKDSAKLSSRIDIQKDDVLDVLAITKSRQLLNTASLTGRQVSQAMRIYMVSASGRISDITLQSSCHAADESILKVSPSCTSVYLDGSEVRGSQNATVLIKYGTFTGQGNFVVWMPKLPLDIRVDDNKLSQVKSWKTPQIKRKHSVSPIQDDSPVLSIQDNLAHSKHSNIRNEFIEGIASNNNNYIGCRLRYQQTRVEVFTRFFSTDHNSGREASLLSRRLSIRVTHLLMPYIRVSDPKVLILRGNIIEGLNVGRSEVQVISPITGRLMGAKEIRVAADKETLTHLDVKIVAGLELQVKPDENLPNVWMTKTTLLDRLTTQYQEGLIDIKLHFSDSSSIALSDISASDYNLSVDTFDGAVALAPNTGLYPRVIAIGPGHGQLLHLSLELANQCQRKRTQPIAMKYVNINVDFSTSSLQNDAYNYRKTNGAVLTRNNQTVNSDAQPVNMKERLNTNQFLLNEKPNDEPSLQARHNVHSLHPVNMANFKVGVVSFLAIFGIAIIMIAVLYTILYYRHQVKDPPEAITTTRIGPITSTNRPVVANANEWVWLGKATLERNSIRTNCAQTLLPQKDYNGNLPVNNTTTKDKDKDQIENNANRLSAVSFPGSEISIRITTNPNPAEDIDDDEGSTHSHKPKISCRTSSIQNQNNSFTQPPIPARKHGPHSQSKFSTYSKPPPIPPHRSQNRCKTNLNEIKSVSANPHPPPVPSHRNLRSSKRSNSKSQIVAEKLKVDLPLIQNKSNWNETTNKMDYNQLMEYFDNLKESNA